MGDKMNGRASALLQAAVAVMLALCAAGALGVAVRVFLWTSGLGG